MNHEFCSSRRALLQGLGASLIGSVTFLYGIARAEPPWQTPRPETIAFFHPDNAISAEFASRIGSPRIAIGAEDLVRVWRREVQASRIAGLTDWTSFVMLRELGLESGLRVRFEARHDRYGGGWHHHIRRQQGQIDASGSVTRELLRWPMGVRPRAMADQRGTLFTWLLQ